MKLIFVTSTLHAGGSERVMSLLANNLVDRGYIVEIICINKHIVFYPLNKVIKLKFAEDEVGPSELKKTLWLRKHIKEECPDIVIAFMLEVYCLTLASLIGVKIPIISSERVDPKIFGIPKKLLRWVLLRKTTSLVVQTEDIKRYYSKSIQAKTTVIANPVTEKVFNLQHVSKEKILIAVGRLDYQKNYPMMIRAFADICDEFPGWKLMIYGEGPERDSLESLISNFKFQISSRISLPGRSEKVIEEMNRAKVFVMTSDFEGMSNAMLEAVCVGLPVVTTNVSGASELIDENRGGFVVPIGDIKAFEEKLRIILSSETFLQKMGEFNKKKAPQYQEYKIVDQWESLIIKNSKK